MIFTANGADDELAHIRRLRDGSDIDAFILIATFHGDPRISWLIDHEVPFVSFGRRGALNDRIRVTAGSMLTGARAYATRQDGCDWPDVSAWRTSAGRAPLARATSDGPAGSKNVGCRPPTKASTRP